MDKQIDKTLEAMAKSQEQISRALEAEKRIVSRMAKVIRSVHPEALTVRPGEPYSEAEHSIAREISSYLHTIADLEDALADNLKALMKELRGEQDQE